MKIAIGVETNPTANLVVLAAGLSSITVATKIIAALSFARSRSIGIQPIGIG